MTPQPPPNPGTETARELLIDKLLIDFYAGKAFDPHAKRPADVVRAAIAFALTSSPPSIGEMELRKALERAARIIDPVAWGRRDAHLRNAIDENWQKGHPHEAVAASMRETAYRLADQVVQPSIDKALAILAPKPLPPAGDVRALVEKGWELHRRALGYATGIPAANALLADCGAFAKAAAEALSAQSPPLADGGEA